MGQRNPSWQTKISIETPEISKWSRWGIAIQERKWRFQSNSTQALQFKVPGVGPIAFREVLDLGSEIYKSLSVILKKKRPPRKEEGHKKERKEEEEDVVYTFEEAAAAFAVGLWQRCMWWRETQQCCLCLLELSCFRSALLPLNEA